MSSEVIEGGHQVRRFREEQPYTRHRLGRFAHLRGVILLEDFARDPNRRLVANCEILKIC